LTIIIIIIKDVNPLTPIVAIWVQL